MKASFEMIPPFPSNKTVAAKEKNSHLSSADNSGRLPVLLHPGHHHPSLQLPSSRHCCHPATNLVFAHFRQHWQHCCCCPLSLSCLRHDDHWPSPPVWFLTQVLLGFCRGNSWKHDEPTKISWSTPLLLHPPLPVVSISISLSSYSCSHFKSCSTLPDTVAAVWLQLKAVHPCSSSLAFLCQFKTSKLHQPVPDHHDWILFHFKTWYLIYW